MWKIGKQLTRSFSPPTHSGYMSPTDAMMSPCSKAIIHGGKKAPKITKYSLPVMPLQRFWLLHRVFRKLSLGDKENTEQWRSNLFQSHTTLFWFWMDNFAREKKRTTSAIYNVHLFTISPKLSLSRLNEARLSQSNYVDFLSRTTYDSSLFLLGFFPFFRGQRFAVHLLPKKRGLLG